MENCLVEFVEGLKLGTPFNDSLRWEQKMAPFTQHLSPLYYPDCAFDAAGITDKWTHKEALYLPIKLLNEEGSPLLGWIKCQFDRKQNPIYESFVLKE